MGKKNKSISLRGKEKKKSCFKTIKKSGYLHFCYLNIEWVKVRFRSNMFHRILQYFIKIRDGIVTIELRTLIHTIRTCQFVGDGF